MARYRKLPVVVDADLYEPGMEDGYEVFNKYSIDPLEEPFCIDKETFSTIKTPLDVLCPLIKTLEGWMKISPGDYIITGVAGERYPCKPDIFARTYEVVVD